MAELKQGSTLQNGKYEITKVLGSGNFGITYLASTRIAVNGQLGQMNVTVNVAIKEFYMKDLNNRTSDGTTVEGTQNTLVKNYRQKFRKEAENLAKLNHPNIVKVIEVFDENNTTYYVMEYIEGGSLDDYIKQKGHLSEDEALKCTIEIGSALSYMHKNRMIHLDLKPKNVMRNQNGTLFLIDFGLSKQYDENGEPESSTSIGLGTPGYAPIEQAHYKKDGSLPVTLDIYALGATLFKMLTGKTPPEASYILNEGLPLSLLNQIGISADVISVVERAMSPMKRERYQTVASMAETISFIPNDTEQTNFQDEEDGTKYDEPIDSSYPNDNISKKRIKNNNATSKKKIGVYILAIIVGVVIISFISIFTSQKTVNSKEKLLFDEKEVNLGLPSGTIWAGWNVGASSAEEKGNLYAWGEVIPKKIFKSEDYFDSKYYKFITILSNSVIQTANDVAYITWGKGWCMPTKEQFDELLSSCEWKWGTYKGCNGMIARGPNGNSIFFPTTGYGNENNIWYRNKEGNYWCGELCSPNKHDHSNYSSEVDAEADSSKRAYLFSFEKDYGIATGCGQRYYGQAIRAVKVNKK